MQIRDFDETDRPQVVALWKSTFSGATGHNDPEFSIDRKVEVDDRLFFVAVEADTVIGTVLAGYDGHRGWLYSLAVAPEFRRQGIATRLVRHAERALVQRGCAKLNLQVHDDNAKVVAFYEAIGYRIEDRISMGKLMAD